MEKRLIHIYTGDGKGKTTAAIGLAVRAKGAGLRVLFAQFLKGSETGELESLRKLDIPVIRSHVKKFIPYMSREEKDDCRREQADRLEEIRSKAADYDLVVLDEILGAISTEMVDFDRLLAFVRHKPARTELVLTGRDAPQELIGLADYVSEILCIKHPYEKGIQARRGIEF